MTREEFSNTFDTLLNSYNTDAVFGEPTSKSDIVLDEYEKSVLLTQAQDIIVKSYFNTNNPNREGFDDSARRQMDFSELITVANPSRVVNSDEVPYVTYDERGVLFQMPSNILFILNEKIKDSNSKQYVVIPINYKEYDRHMSKAYSQPLKKQAWRLFQDTNQNDVDLYSEIIPIEGVDISSYKIRYIRRPKPIILEDLSFADSQSPLQIDGQSEASDCELNPIIHMDILNKAIELALATRGRMVPAENK